MRKYADNNKSVTVKSIKGDKIILNIESKSNAILVAINNYSPYWKAYVNGKKKEVFPVYHTFCGVHVTSDTDEVILKYEPPYPSWY